VIAPDVASFERVVLTVARPSGGSLVAVAISPAAIALASFSWARTVVLVAARPTPPAVYALSAASITNSRVCRARAVLASFSARL
jgi:hypothetical protein